MSTAEMIVAAMGPFDVFDKVRSLIDHIQHLLEEEEMPCELHGVDQGELFQAGGTMHLFDPKADMRARLQRARELIREAEQMCEAVLVEIP